MLDDDTNDRAVMGDNKPPAYDAEIVADLNEKVAEFLRVTQQWLDLPKIETELHAGQMTDQIDGLRGLFKNVDDARKGEKKPHDDAGKVVQAAFKPMLDKLTIAASALKPKLAVYAKAQQAIAQAKRREEKAAAKVLADEAAAKAKAAEESNDIAAQVEAEAATKEAEAATKKAEAPVKTNVKSASGGGRTMHMRPIKDVEVTNVTVLFMEYRGHPKVLELLTRLATTDVRAAGYVEGTIKGIEVKERQVMA